MWSRMRSKLISLAGLLVVLATVPASAQRRPAFVVFSSPPLVEHLAATSRQTAVRDRLLTPEAETYKSALRAEKAPLVARMEERGIVVESQIETVLNAVLIQATDEDLAWLRTQPGVTAADFTPAVHPHLDTAANLISAPAVWNSLGGSLQAGRGIRIAIIDSGIDQTHPMFADSGFTAPGGFPRADKASNLAFTNNKVIVARNYVCPVSGNCPNSSGPNDLNASDGVGHGTFVASVAAGRSVTTIYNTTITGIAPGAYLGSYKVFPVSGNASGNAVLTALNDAVSDGMNLINFSGGSEPGGKAASDAYASSINNVLLGGVLMIVSAGNCGPASAASTECTGVTAGDATIGSPAELPGVLSAGASTNSHILMHTFKVTSPAPPASLQNVGFIAGSVPAFNTTIGPAPLVDVTPSDPTSQACSALPNLNLSGSIAVIKRGNCTFSTKITNATAAGAVGVLLYDNVSEPLSTIGTGIGTPATAIESGIMTAADGANLLAFLQANPNALGQMSGTQSFYSQQADLVSNYSSRGPTADYAIKPDLVAPGDMFAASQETNSTGTAVIYDPSGFVAASGTSFAAPMTSGSAAVLKSARPSLTATDIKSVLVNSATPLSGAQDGAPASVMNMGGGRLNLQAAMNATLTSSPVSVSFKLITLSTTSQSQTVTIKNVGTQSDVVAVTVTPILGGAGLQVTASPSSISLAAGASAPVTIQIVATSAQQGIFEGFITLTGQQSAIHVPYWTMFGPPVIFTGGVTEGAGFGKKVAPGSIISLFGTSLGGDGVLASTLPLPTDVGHSVVNISSGGVSGRAPMFYSSSGQLNAQLPFTASGSAQAQVSLQGLTSNTVALTLASAAPGIFNYNNGVGVALHPDYSLVTATNPAQAGEVIAIYCTGLGAVTPTVTAGVAAPLSPLSVTPSFPTVTIGGQTASVSYSGLASGFVGLYQVNAMVPNGLASGGQTVTMSMLGNTSNAVTINVK
jgi:minor extracellular serine protease Vpr